MMRRLTKVVHQPFFSWLERAGLFEPPSYGLNGLDKKILPYIQKRHGFFVEAGANNGLSQSNTAYLEFWRGWNGLLVEPIPELAAQCRRNRPRSIVEQTALVERGHDGKTVDMIYCNLMSLVEGARGSPEADAEHIKRGMQFLSPDDQPRTIKVPTATLSDLLDQHGIEHVDLLSLDVEGYESMALRGLDMSRHAPSWIVVEANDRQSIDDVLEARYELVDVLSHHDCIYRLKT